ncbi:MAG: 16S rRNA (cytosine(1402)-N(4))-methyltransferase RsmH [Patescibacteria group bacterium]
MSSESSHVAVLTEEVMTALRPHSSGKYVDCTLGGATHTENLLKLSAPQGRVLSFDVDPVALNRARSRLKVYGKRWLGIEANFRNLLQKAKANGFIPCDGIVFDLGFSSDELADPEKGLSFQQDGPLDMRLGLQANENGLTASDIVNGWSRDEIEDALREYGEERYARRIADGLIAARKNARINRTAELADIVSSSVPRNYERGRIHPATRTFQALRIAVNDELQALREALEAARRILAPHGRLAVISFNSLEDRIVKRAFKAADDLEVLTKRPIRPTHEEVRHNPRARSAKLRVAEKR